MKEKEKSDDGDVSLLCASYTKQGNPSHHLLIQILFLISTIIHTFNSETMPNWGSFFSKP